eukprot:scaffold139886_cov60-Attheya_sp.AAC.1
MKNNRINAGPQEPFHTHCATLIDGCDSVLPISDNGSVVSRDLSVADGASIVRRKPKRRTYYKYRNSALSASEWVELERRCTILQAADAALMTVHPEEVSIPRKPPVLELRSFDLISEAFVYHNLRFNLPDLVTVFKALDFPTTFTTEK